MASTNRSEKSTRSKVGRGGGALTLQRSPPAETRSRAASVGPSERQRQIYVEAARLFVEKGYDATSMSDIADAMKMTKAGIYHFIRSKEELLFTIISFGMDELYEEVVAPALMVRDPHDRLRLIVRNHLVNIGRVDTSLGNPVTIVVDASSGLSTQRRKIIDQRKLEYFNLVRATIAELVKSGAARSDLNTTVAAHTVIGMILWMARWRRPNGKLSLDRIIEQITGIVIAGIGVKTTGKSR